MSRTKDWLFDEMAVDARTYNDETDCGYDEWLASMASMEDERFARTPVPDSEARVVRPLAPESHLFDTSHHQPIPLSEAELASIARTLGQEAADEARRSFEEVL